PNARPRPRFGLHGTRRLATAWTSRRTALTPRVARKLRGCLGRRTWVALTVGQPSSSTQGGDHALHVLEGHAHRGAMGAHLDAGGALRPPEAEVAFGGQLDVLAVGPQLVHLHHRDVPPRTAGGAVAAPDAGRGVDLHLQGSHRARDGPGGTVHHAGGVGALVAGGGHEPVAVALPLPDEAGLALVGVRAAPHALVAAGARGEVD